MSAPERIWLDRFFQPWRVFVIQLPDLPEYVLKSASDADIAAARRAGFLEAAAALDEAGTAMMDRAQAMADAAPAFTTATAEEAESFIDGWNLQRGAEWLRARPEAKP